MKHHLRKYVHWYGAWLVWNKVGYGDHVFCLLMGSKWCRSNVNFVWTLFIPEWRLIILSNTHIMGLTAKMTVYTPHHGLVFTEYASKSPNFNSGTTYRHELYMRVGLWLVDLICWVVKLPGSGGSKQYQEMTEGVWAAVRPIRAILQNMLCWFLA